MKTLLLVSAIGLAPLLMGQGCPSTQDINVTVNVDQTQSQTQDNDQGGNNGCTTCPPPPTDNPPPTDDPPVTETCDGKGWDPNPGTLSVHWDGTETAGPKAVMKLFLNGIPLKDCTTTCRQVRDITVWVWNANGTVLIGKYTTSVTPDSATSITEIEVSLPPTGPFLVKGEADLGTKGDPDSSHLITLRTADKIPPVTP